MRPPVLPSASMTLLFAVAGVAIYWITAAVAQLRLQHSYSKFEADKWYVHGTRPPSPSSPLGIQMDHAPVGEEPRGMKVIPSQCAAAGLAATPINVIGNVGRPRPRGCVRRDPADPSRTRHFTSIHTDSTDTEETR